MSLPAARLALAACAAFVLLTAPGSAHLQPSDLRGPIEQIQDPSPVSSPGTSQAPDPSVRVPQPRTEPRAFAPAPAEIDARLLSGIAAVLVVGLLFVLYFYRRRGFILYWVAGWTLAAAATFIAAYPYRVDPRIGYSIYGFSQFLRIVAGLVFVLSADAYHSRPELRRSYGVALLPVLLWFTLAPPALGPGAAFAPGHLLMAGALGAAGIAHLSLLRHVRLFGALIVGVTLLMAAAVNVWIALTVAQPSDPVLTRIGFLTLAVGLVTALGMQLMTFEDMTYELRGTNRRLQHAQAELRELVTTDALTGCRNRRYFDEIIGKEVQRHARYNIPLSMLFVDIDHFKAINDTLGHDAGDRVLQQVAAFLVRNVREADYVFRWGGDEFLILISCREDEAISKASDLQAAFAESANISSLPPGVGLSVGCAEVPATVTDIYALVSRADERMYENKRGIRLRA